MASVLLDKSRYFQKLYWATRTVMLRTFGITKAKPALYIACSHTSTQMCTNLFHPPLAIDAKDTVPCSDLLVSRKNRRNLVTKHLESFQDLCWMFNALQNLKLWVYFLLVVSYAPLFTSTFTIDTSFFHSAFLCWGLQFSPGHWVQKRCLHSPVSSPCEQDQSLWLNVVKLPRIL